MPEYQEKSIVQTCEQFSPSVYRLTLHAPLIAQDAQPGQFVMADVSGGAFDPLLRRPFSLHQVTTQGDVQILFQVVGKGTSFLSRLAHDDTLSLIGPLGRGFSIDDPNRLCLIGGGMGMAPLLFLAGSIMKHAKMDTPPIVLLGSGSGDALGTLPAEFAACGCVTSIATDDGSLGHTGYVTDLLSAHLSTIRKVFTCGPLPMMASVARLCREADVPCEASLETHMACGLGACLGCAVSGADGRYKHVCKQGPVFNANEIQWVL